MRVLGLLASAEVSKDLEHHEQQCHVDILGAAGMARFNKGTIAIYRYKYMLDQLSYIEAISQFRFWTLRALQRRKVKRNMMSKDSIVYGADELANSIFEYWVNSVCGRCNGRKFKMIHGTPNLSDKPCDLCYGTGEKKLHGSKEIVQIKLDVIGKANRAMCELNGIISRKLGKK
jgi:hypothetical protein